MRARQRLNRFAYCSALALTLAPVPGKGADADNGSRLALRWCEACHVVSATQRRASTDQAPPFATIAKRRGFDAAKGLSINNTVNAIFGGANFVGLARSCSSNRRGTNGDRG